MTRPVHFSTARLAALRPGFEGAFRRGLEPHRAAPWGDARRLALLVDGRYAAARGNARPPMERFLGAYARGPYSTRVKRERVDEAVAILRERNPDSLLFFDRLVSRADRLSPSRLRQFSLNLIWASRFVERYH